MITVGVIVETVAAHYGINPISIRSNRRTRKVMLPRFMACYLAHQMTELSLPAIGRLLGGRDHTTILNAIRKFSGILENDAVVRADFEIVERSLEYVAATMAAIRKTPPKDIDPLAVAKRVLENEDCILVSQDAIQALAISVVASLSDSEQAGAEELAEPEPLDLPQVTMHLIERVETYIAARLSSAPKAEDINSPEARALMAMKAAVELVKIHSTTQKQEALHA